jgi:hypothetical protein
VVLDPDARVRETIQHLFETFSRAGSTHRTVRIFRQEGIEFPVRVRSRGCPTKVVFAPLTVSTINRELHNPRHAGTYA